MTASSFARGTIQYDSIAIRPIEAAGIETLLRRFCMVLVGVVAIAVAVPLAIATQQDGQMFVD